ncbi:hypothetical protein [Nocardioides psychrotolerans]|uniref:hypothetical protein n=1 Tax=Nocardioides psychrotolerans TaxID=1005945 RepID=UPI003137C00B
MHALRSLFAAVVLVAGVLVTIVATQSAAAADGPDCPPGTSPVQDAGGGWICIVVTDPGEPGTEDPGDNGGEVVSVAGGCFDGAKKVPCIDEYGGTWDVGRRCYAFQIVPQPEAGSLLWKGHDPSEGSVWSCDRTVAIPENTWFVPNGVDPLIDPGVLAQDALGRMKLRKARANIAPKPGFHTYVGIDNWLWLPASQWHNITETVTAGPTSVTVTAEPIRVEWDMGADVKSCYDAGRAWKAGMTDAALTSCSFAYKSIEDPTGDKFTVSAHLVYGVTWDCDGACLSPQGDLGEVAALAGIATTIEVRQRQTVVTQ